MESLKESDIADSSFRDELEQGGHRGAGGPSTCSFMVGEARRRRLFAGLSQRRMTGASPKIGQSTAAATFRPLL
jgi:hypothetical protein